VFQELTWSNDMETMQNESTKGIRVKFGEQSEIAIDPKSRR